MSQQIWKIDFKTDTAFFNKTEIVEVAAYSFLSKNDCEYALIKIKNLCIADGYICFNYDSNVYNAGICNVYAYIGNQYLIRKIEINSLKSNVEFNNNILDTNRFLSLDYLRNIQLGILREVEQNAFPNPSIEIESFTISGDSADIVFSVNSGEPGLFDTVVNSGNLKINYNLLLSFLGLKKGEPFSKKAVELQMEKLSLYDFLELKKEIALSSKGRKIILNIHIDKKNVNTFDGIVGLISDSENSGKLKLTGNVSIFLKNSFNYAESFAFEWLKSESQSQHLNFESHFPFLPPLPVGIAYELDFFKKDTSFIKVRHTPGISYSRRSPNAFRLFASFESVTYLTVPDYVQGLRFSAYNYNSWTFGYTLDLKHLDRFINPKNGYSSSITMASGKKNIIKNAAINPLVYDSINLVSLKSFFTLEYSFYKQLFKYSVFKFETKTGIISNENLNQAELFRLGGLKSLRGFDEESILASHYLIFDFETRLPLDKQSYVFLFGTKGFVKNSIDLNNTTNFPYSFGAGISIRSNLGMFSLVYALGSQYNQSIQIRSSKVHFGYLTRF